MLPADQAAKVEIGLATHAAVLTGKANRSLFSHRVLCIENGQIEAALGEVGNFLFTKAGGKGADRLADAILSRGAQRLTGRQLGGPDCFAATGQKGGGSQNGNNSQNMYH